MRKIFASGRRDPDFCWKEQEDPEYCRLAVENTGVWIPKEKIPRLFQAFYRVEGSRNKETGGSGLGCIW